MHESFFRVSSVMTPSVIQTTFLSFHEENASGKTCKLLALGTQQGTEVNLKIKQAAANGKQQLEHPNCILSTQTTIGAREHHIGHHDASGHGGESEHQAVCWPWKTAIGAPKPVAF